MKNIHILPTDKPSKLHTYKGVLNLAAGEFVAPAIVKNDLINQHIYITSDEVIRVGDWVYNIVSKNIFKASKQLIDLINDPNVTLTTNKKIIITTDGDLIKDGVQSIDDEFLEWFVKNPTCEEVEVEEKSTYEIEEELNILGHDIGLTERDFEEWLKDGGQLYKIIIPEEQKQLRKKLCNVIDMIEQEESIPVWKQIIETCGGEEEFMKSAGLLPKEETLQEAAKRLIPDKSSFGATARNGFMLGANWQAEKMYNEKDVTPLLNALKYFTDRVEFGTIKSKTTYKMYKEVLEQFKKK